MTIFGLAESFKTMNQPDPARHYPTVTLLDDLFLRNNKRDRREILTQSSFKSSICAINIWNRYL